MRARDKNIDQLSRVGDFPQTESAGFLLKLFKWAKDKAQGQGLVRKKNLEPESSLVKGEC